MSFAFYTVDVEYCEDLKKIDTRVPLVLNNKEKRPFIGILINIDGIEYYAPLTSPKPKHITMSNGLDFTKINDGKLGAINFCNMIPVIDSYINRIDIAIRPGDSQSIVKYKHLLRDQFHWCNSRKEAILKKATRLYRLIVTDKAPPNITTRCCDFKKLEAYINKKYKNGC